MDDQLKPCPLCGGDASEDATGTAEYYGHEHQSVSIECGSCGVSLTIHTACRKDGSVAAGYEFACSCCNDTMAVARQRWNRRPADLERDAGRYRKLRTMHWHADELCVVRNPSKAVRPGYDCPSEARLDEAIDALPDRKE